MPSICGARDQSETTSAQTAASAPTLHLAVFTIGQRTFGVDAHYILLDFPELQPEDIRAALQLLTACATT